MLLAFYGDAPAHIRMTFGMDRPECPYEVVREGERIPDEWEQALIIHHNDGYNALRAADLLVQLQALNPSGIVFVLPVQVETPAKSFDEVKDLIIKPYRYP